MNFSRYKISRALDFLLLYITCNKRRRAALSARFEASNPATSEMVGDLHTAIYKSNSLTKGKVQKSVSHRDVHVDVFNPMAHVGTESKGTAATAKMKR